MRADRQIKNIFLENSRDIRDSLSDLFSSIERKYAVVAFVGKNAIDYLPNFKNTTVVCWPKAGGTNPEGIRKLINSGVTVKFCDHLHSKIFWCESKGIIVSSSNLSDNALGDSGLIEFAVRINDPEYDFCSKVLNPLKKKLRDVSDEELNKLDVENNRFNRKNDIKHSGKSERKDYSEWYKSKHRQKWKIVWYSEISKQDEITKDEVFEEFGVTKWKNDNDVDPGMFSEGDIVFQFKMDEYECTIPRANGKWFYVDMVTSNNKIIQVGKLENIALPFVVDPAFKKAFKRAFSELDWDHICDEKKFSQKKFLDLIYEYYLQKS